MDVVVAGGLVDLNAVIEGLQRQFGVIRHLHVEIEDHAVPMGAVAAMTERPVFVQAYEVALLRHVQLDVPLGFRHGFTRIGVYVFLHRHLHLRSGGAGDVNEAVDTVHQQLPCAAPGGIESAPNGLLLVELPAMVAVPAGGRQRQGRHHQDQ